MTMKNDACDDF